LAVAPAFPVELLGVPAVAAVHLAVVRARGARGEELGLAQQGLHRLAAGQQRGQRARGVAHLLTSVRYRSTSGHGAVPGGPRGCAQSPMTAPRVLGQAPLGDVSSASRITTTGDDLGENGLYNPLWENRRWCGDAPAPTPRSARDRRIPA